MVHVVTSVVVDDDYKRVGEPKVTVVGVYTKYEDARQAMLRELLDHMYELVLEDTDLKDIERDLKGLMEKETLDHADEETIETLAGDDRFGCQHRPCHKFSVTIETRAVN